MPATGRPDPPQPPERARRSQSATPVAPDARPTWARLHLWQVQAVRDLLVWGGVLGLLLLGHRLSLVTVPLLLALLLAYLLEPLVHLVTRLPHVGRKLATTAVLLAGLLVVLVPLALGATFAAIQGAKLAQDVGGRVGRVIDSVQEPEDEALRERVGGGAWLSIRDFLVELRTPRASEARHERELLGVDTEDVARVVDDGLAWLREHADQLGKQALTTGRGALDVLVHAAGSLGRLALGTFLTAFFLFFVSANWEALQELARGLVPKRNRARTLELARRMDRAVSGFIRGRLTIALILAGFYALTFWLIGVPAPLLWGPAIAVLAIVPYVPVLGLPIVIVLLLLEPHEGFRGAVWWGFVAPLAVYQVGQMLDDYLLTPWIQGESTGLSTPVILFASLAGASLLGFYGLLLAIPLAACLKIVVDEVVWPRFRAWAAGKERDFLPIDEDAT